jgi:hypothetical protein
MKKIAIAAFAAFAACVAAPVVAQPNVGVSIGIHQPGVYGRVDIGNVPPPPVVYAQPVVIAPPRVVVQRQPIYLYVPPAHQRNWRTYCGRYSACNQPVYFVQERWIRERWDHEHRDHRDARRGPPGHDDHGPGRGHGRGHGKGHGKGHGHDG